MTSYCYWIHLHIGKLKLIDFGIAKALSADTTNIMRDSQIGKREGGRELHLNVQSRSSPFIISIGTLNYMSPEALVGKHHTNISFFSPYLPFAYLFSLSLKIRDNQVMGSA